MVIYERKLRTGRVLGALTTAGLIGYLGFNATQSRFDLLDDDVLAKNHFAEYVANNEGRRLDVYCARNPKEKDRKKFIEPTIGVGHYLDKEESKRIFQEALPHLSWDEVYSGKKQITKEDSDKLLGKDLEEKIDMAKNLFINFNSYPIGVQTALVDGVYRGEYEPSHKTVKLINENKFEEAAKEYINRSDYRNAIQKGIPGIRKRMNKNQKAFISYSKKLNVN